MGFISYQATRTCVNCGHEFIGDAWDRRCPNCRLAQAIVRDALISPEHEALRQTWLAEEAASFQGWDFSYLDRRFIEEPLPWDYREVVWQYLQPEHRLLDMGTGGGEVLLSLEHPYDHISVTEAYAPNVAMCLEYLAPLGITVRQIYADDVVPYDDAAFDIVINRHESFDISEVKRVLKPGGVFITQQVGGDNGYELSKVLAANYDWPHAAFCLAGNIEIVQDAGFTVLQSEECHLESRFIDVGAVVYYAKVIPWQFPDFSAASHFSELMKLQHILEQQGYIPCHQSRFYLVARRQ